MEQIRKRYDLVYPSKADMVTDLLAKEVATLENGELVQTALTGAIIHGSAKILEPAIFEGMELVKAAVTDGLTRVTLIMNRTVFFSAENIDSESEITIGGFTQTETTLAQDLASDMAIGKELLAMFLIDNRNQPTKFTPEQSGKLLQKFGVVKALSEVGDVKNMKIMLSMITVDAIFTQERKDKYVNFLNDYLNSK